MSELQRHSLLWRITAEEASHRLHTVALVLKLYSKNNVMHRNQESHAQSGTQPYSVLVRLSRQPLIVLEVLDRKSVV